MDKYKLNDGVEIPSIGLGTWQSEKSDAYRATLAAIACGYRHIDTAYAYENEDAVGRAVKDCALSRDQIFIGTKLPSHIKSYDGAKEYLELSLKALGTDYVDLYMIHAPWPWIAPGTDCTEGNIEAFRAMIDMKAEGKIRTVGVSNFNGEQIDSIIAATGVTPSVNQIRFFIGNTQQPIYEYCQKKGILVEAYSPLATGKMGEVDKIGEMAAKYGVSFAKICIAYCLQKGTLPLPKSVTPARIAENFEVGVVISDEDIAVLDGIKGLFPRPYRS